MNHNIIRNGREDSITEKPHSWEQSLPCVCELVLHGKLPWLAVSTARNTLPCPVVIDPNHAGIRAEVVTMRVVDEPVHVAACIAICIPVWFSAKRHSSVQQSTRRATKRALISLGVKRGRQSSQYRTSNTIVTV